MGVLFCRLWVLYPSACNGFSCQGNLLTGMWRLFGIAIAVMIVSNVANLAVRTAEMSGQPIQTIVPIVPTVLFHSHYGRVLLVRIAALLLMAIMWKGGVRFRESRVFLFFMLGLGLIVCATDSASGHAADAGDFSVAEIMEWLHLLAAYAWGGGLLVLSVFLLPVLVKEDDHIAPLVAGVAGRFSRIAGVAVAVVAITALYNVWVYVGSVEALWGSAYGRAAVAKIVLFLILINLGAFNRYVNVPALQEWGGLSPQNRGNIGRLADIFVGRFRRDQSGHRVALRFMHSVRAEAFLVVLTLFFAAILLHGIPARHLSHEMSGHGHSMEPGQEMQHNHDMQPGHTMEPGQSMKKDEHDMEKGQSTEKAK